MPPAANAGEDVLCQAQVEAIDDWQEHRVALRVLPAMRAEVAVVLNELLERRGLIGRTEGPAGHRQRLEVHLRRVARNVDQIVAGDGVAVRVAREHIARVAVGVAVVERRDRRRAPAEVLMRVRPGEEDALAR